MYRGWSIVGTTMATQAAQAGLLIYGFSALALPLEQEFGATRFEVMIAATCLSLASSALAPLAGRWVDKGSVRSLMLGGAIALALGLALVAAAQSIWQVWLAYALLLPLANVLLGQLTSAALVTRWFSERRGRAMGLSAMGTSIGGFVFPLLIASGAEAMGWRSAILVIGLVSAAILFCLIMLGIANRADGSERVLTPAETNTFDSGSATARILASPAFWIITLGVGVKLATYLGFVSNLGGLAAGIGVEPVQAAGLVSILSIISMIGKLAFGALAERFSARSLFIAALASTIAGFALLTIASSLGMLALACLLLGLSTGGMLPLWSLIVGQYFGEASFGRALGLTNLAMVPLTAAASPLAGWAHDRTGSYDAAIWGSIAGLAVATVLLLFLPQSRVASS